jgi:hypothetical protein
MTAASPELPQSGNSHRIGDQGDAPRPARKKRVGWFVGPSLGCVSRGLRSSCWNRHIPRAMAHTKAASSGNVQQIFGSSNGLLIRLCYRSNSNQVSKASFSRPEAADAEPQEKRRHTKADGQARQI